MEGVRVMASQVRANDDCVEMWYHYYHRTHLRIQDNAIILRTGYMGLPGTIVSSSPISFLSSVK